MLGSVVSKSDKFKWVSIVAIGLALLFLLLGFYFQGAWSTQGRPWSPAHHQTSAIKEKDTLCSYQRWLKIGIEIGNNQLELVDNHQLFERFNSETEVSGRHTGAQSISLSLFIQKNEEILSVQTCGGDILHYNKDKLALNKPRLVLNQKGAFKIISSVNDKIVVDAKYLYSISSE